MVNRGRYGSQRVTVASSAFVDGILQGLYFDCASCVLSVVCFRSNPEITVSQIIQPNNIKNKIYALTYSTEKTFDILREI